jgi:triosephosphate isomerase (TIM)
MRQVIIAANWKMHKTANQAKEFISKISVEWKNCNVIICPSYSILSTLYTAAESSASQGKKFFIGAQNMHYETSGAFTGETSPEQVKEFADYVIIGHSERRQIFGEDDNIINKKLITAINTGLIPILCVGETIREREANKEYSVISKQLDEGLRSLDSDDMCKLIIAYEPVWAIGTGKIATPQMAQEMHYYIRNQIRNTYREIAEKIPIIYGGSVKADNFNNLLKCDDVDGALIGGASLNAESFSELIMIGELHNIDLLNIL